MSYDEAPTDQIIVAWRTLAERQEIERAAGRRRPADTADGWRWCSACNLYHPRAAFGPSNGRRKGPADGLRSACLVSESRQVAARKARGGG